MRSQILLVGFGGFLGAICRFVLGHLFRQYIVHPFPFGTFIINFLGCVGIGFLSALFKTQPFSTSITLVLGVGFLGAFTTFSAFTFETMELLKQDQIYLAALNIFGSVAVCLIGVFIGEWISRH